MFNKKNFVALGIGFFVFAVIVYIEVGTRFLDGLERNLQKTFFQQREPAFKPDLYSEEDYNYNRFVHSKSRIIGIDERSLSIIGKWPWPRAVHANLVENLQQFSPDSIYIDLLFINPETLPESLEDRLASRPQLRGTLDSLYRASDTRLAKTLSNYNNVYIAQQLMPKLYGRGPNYVKRIEQNAQHLKQLYSKPAQDYDIPMFRDLEPIIRPILEGAHPVTVNIRPDNDNILRSFSLLHTYAINEGNTINTYTVILAMLMNYYKVTPSQVEVFEDRIVLKGAVVPPLDPRTRQEVVTNVDSKRLLSTLGNQRRPPNAAYNTNLYHYLVNHARLNEAALEFFAYPIYLDERNKIVTGWEVFDAVKATDIKNTRVVPCKRTDLVIPTRRQTLKAHVDFLHTFLINYSGKEHHQYLDPFDGVKSIRHTIATSSYYEPGKKPPLPSLPILSGSRGRGSPEQLSKWFVEYTKAKVVELSHKVKRRYGEASFEKVVEYIFEYGEPMGKFFVYDLFFQNGGSPLESEFYLAFADALEEEGVPVDDDLVPPLGMEEILYSLQEAYGEGFQKFYNKSLFVGMRAIGVAYDKHETPYGSMYGINTIANAFATITTDNMLRVSSDTYNLAFLFVFCIVVALLHRFLKTLLNFMLFVAAMGGLFLYAYLVFYANNLIVEVIPLLFANAFLLILTILYRVIIEERDRKFLKTTFSSYLSPELIDDMFHSKTMPTLGGETRIVTAFFTDIQGFSTFSEKLTAQQLVELLNEYLSQMTQILTDEKGTLDKYEGDAIIAFIGAPMDIPSHAYNACKTAIKMQQKLVEMRQKWSSETYNSELEKRNTKNSPPEEWAPESKWPKIVHDMRMRIGINTGEIVVGNMGSQLRMNYTMMGDAVNLAARLEAAAKQYGVFTIVSEQTLSQSYENEEGEVVTVKDLVECRFLDQMRVVGRREPTKVFELLALKGELDEAGQSLVKLFEAGMRAYIDMDWEAAIEKFKAAVEFEPNKELERYPSKVFIERCRALRNKPPVAKGEAWDGVWTLSEK